MWLKIHSTCIKTSSHPLLIAQQSVSGVSRHITQQTGGNGMWRRPLRIGVWSRAPEVTAGLGTQQGFGRVTDESRIGCGQFLTQQMPAMLNRLDRCRMLIGSVCIALQTQSCQCEEQRQQLCTRYSYYKSLFWDFNTSVTPKAIINNYHSEIETLK